MNEATRRITKDSFWENKPTLDDVKACIRAGADLTELVRTGYANCNYPLAYYAAIYLPEAIPEMIKNGMDINQPCREGTAVQLASYVARVKPSGMKALLDNGADIGVKTANAGLACPSLSKLPNSEDRAVVHSVLGSFPSYTGISCVGWALVEGINMRDNPDDKAAEEQRQKVAMLFEAGIHPDAPAYDGEPPIFSTSFCRYEKATQMILDHGGNIDARSTTGDTALTHMAERVAKDFETNWSSENGPLTDSEKSEFLCRDYLERINLLISKGASLNLANAKGESFENGPASKVPFIAQIIQLYHEGGKEAVAEFTEKNLKKWEKEKHDKWYAKYLKKKTSSEESTKRKGVAQRLREALSKKSPEGRKEAKDIAEKFHNGREDDFFVLDKMRPTALNFKKKKER